MPEDSSSESKARTTKSSIRCRLVLVIAEQAALENEPRNTTVWYEGDTILDCESPSYVLQDSVDLTDWIVVELANAVRPLTDDQKQRLRGRVEYRLYSNAAAAWMTVPWRLLPIVGKCHLYVEFGFYLTEI
jgi:hypothetical protein